MSLAGTKCLVTGAGGFLGQRIVCQLLEEEEELAEVRAMDKAFSPETLQRFGKVQTKTVLTIMQGDIRDAAFLHTVVQGVSLVIHTACIIDVLGYIDRQTLFDVNTKGTQLLLDACLHNNVQYFVFTSSIEVTGPNRRGDPIIDGDEDIVYNSTRKFPYAESKKAAEKSVREMDGQPLRNGSSLVTCALRSPYIFGEGSPFLLGHIDACIKNNDVFLRQSRKEALVNPIYVGNIASAHIQVAKAMRDPEKAKRIRGKFYYITDGTPHLSYSDLNYELGKEAGFRIQPKLPMPLTMLYYYALLLEILSFLLWPLVRYIPKINTHFVTLTNTPFSFSSRKAQRDFGYKPRYKWEEAKELTSQWIVKVAPQRKAYLKNKTL